ncbi:hypothetical protein CLIB1444_02S04522 [[Candida] jaroonii]|uniref:Uncharacterized protein n=1 Tax=[Candida] jaroonii TaxID=467808 RepID=A0ACA9Y2Y2_9ASCO|nr:hypothetical protein CLIB1444_02S04522 [[Candida] jaroonii]
MDYDSDDLDYSDNEQEFNEDSLSNEDYQQLYETLPILKKKLQDYNSSIPEIDLKECLYANYFNIEDSVNEIKQNYKSMYKFLEGIDFGRLRG